MGRRRRHRLQGSAPCRPVCLPYARSVYWQPNVLGEQCRYLPAGGVTDLGLRIYISCIFNHLQQLISISGTPPPGAYQPTAHSAASGRQGATCAEAPWRVLIGSHLGARAHDSVGMEPALRAAAWPMSLPTQQVMVFIVDGR